MTKPPDPTTARLLQYAVVLDWAREGLEIDDALCSLEPYEKRLVFGYELCGMAEPPPELLEAIGRLEHAIADRAAQQERARRVIGG